MVDISAKDPSLRVARATGVITMQKATLDAFRGNALAKGDAIATARIAGIMAAKRTAELIPLCHPIPVTQVTLEFVFLDDGSGIRVNGEAKTTAATGIEMEALVAVSVSLITLYDMAKGVDRGMEIDQISVTEKRGGKSGDWVRAAGEGVRP